MPLRLALNLFVCFSWVNMLFATGDHNHDTRINEENISFLPYTLKSNQLFSTDEPLLSKWMSVQKNNFLLLDLVTEKLSSILGT